MMWWVPFYYGILFWVSMRVIEELWEKLQPLTASMLSVIVIANAIFFYLIPIFPLKGILW